MKKSTEHEIEKIIHLLQTQSVISSEFVNDLIEKYKDVQETFDNFESSLDLTKTHVQNLIKNIEPHWFDESSQRYIDLKNYQIQITHDDGTNTYQDDCGIARKGKDPKKIVAKNNFINQVLNTSIKLPDEIKQIIQSRILKYSDWHFAGMIIRPGNETFVDEMVANDPLYLVDEHAELLEPVMNKFSDTYKRRLRTYTDTTLEKLPNNQFAICLAYNYFDHKPVEVIELYLKEIFNKLHAGGVLAMTFNDCDRSSGVEMVEKKSAFYTPGNLIVTLAKNIGYEEIFKINDEGTTTWIELQKPGSLSSIRGGQTLAKIIHK
jgi:hypothetical protein